MTDSVGEGADKQKRKQDLDREIDPRLLEVLICPASREPLTFDRDRNELVSKKARLAYPIRNGVPIMLVDEARDLDDAE